MTRSLFLIAAMAFSSFSVFAQKGAIKGRVFNQLTNESIPFANVAIQNSDKGAVTDIDGKYIIENLSPGLYNIQTTYIGYELKTIFEISVTDRKSTRLNSSHVRISYAVFCLKKKKKKKNT